MIQRGTWGSRGWGGPITWGSYYPAVGVEEPEPPEPSDAIDLCLPFTAAWIDPARNAAWIDPRRTASLIDPERDADWSC